jgi:hypothetical protein
VELWFPRKSWWSVDGGEVGGDIYAPKMTLDSCRIRGTLFRNASISTMAAGVDWPAALAARTSASPGKPELRPDAL